MFYCYIYLMYIQRVWGHDHDGEEKEDFNVHDNIYQKYVYYISLKN